MVPILDLLAHVDDLLDVRSFPDYGPNGLQVPGARDVHTLATGVSASVELFERAAALPAQLVLVHHGLFWKGMPQEIDAALHRRLKPLFAHDLALAAYHLPLDAHPGLGNNAILARELGATVAGPLEVGFVAELDVSAEELRERVARVTGREPLHLAHGPARVRRVGIVSGGAASMFGQAIAAGCDAFVTGEPAERVMTQAREAGVHFLAAGHYATETFGVRALGDHLAERFGIEHVFLDDPNPI
jgi:dinuclear metal center YbgI/SA1388 family protein